VGARRQRLGASARRRAADPARARLVAVPGAAAAPCPHAHPRAGGAVCGARLWLAFRGDGRMRRADAPQPDGGGRLCAPHLPLVQGGAAAAPTASTLRRETGRRRGETAPAPYRHLLLASTLPEDRNALGALGELAATSGAVALCADSRSCARGFQRRVVIPPLPLPPLATLAVQLQTARQMCGAAAARRRRAALQLRSTAQHSSFGREGKLGLGGREPRLETRELVLRLDTEGPRARRPTSLFFRGLHAKSHEAQELRARLWTLRQLPGAAVKFTRGGSASLEPDTRRWLVAQG